MIRVLYFAACQERAGVPMDDVTLARPTVGELRREVGQRRPGLIALLPHCRCAVNLAFVDDDHVIPEDAEVAFIPPVAGGAPRAEVSPAPLSVDRCLKAVQHASCGAIALFVGVVRDHAVHDDETVQVKELRYEAYVDMAVRVIDEIACNVEASTPGARCFVAHRTGTLPIGELAVVVATAAPHRAAAFQGCREIIERLKKEAPIWKKEFSPDGAVWVGLGP